jgi:hypothetical protein
MEIQEFFSNCDILPMIDIDDLRKRKSFEVISL